MTLTPEFILEQLRQLPATSRYRIAYSGGRDSHVLLHLLASLGERLPAPISALHIDHGLQAGSAEWHHHCELTCAELGVDLQFSKLHLQPQPGESLEAQARQARYAALGAGMTTGEILLTAHHQEDQAETVLLQLLRGAGPSGLSAIPRLAQFPPGYHARPLLGVPRQEIEEYALRHRLRWVEDPSNSDTRFDRNFLRQQVMPLLQGRWPAMARTFSRSAAHCADAQEVIDALAAEDLRAIADDGGRLSVGGLLQLPPARARALLRSWIKQAGMPLPDTVHLDRILREVSGAAKDRNPHVHWPGAEVRRYRNRLFLMPPLPAVDPAWRRQWGDETICQLPAGLGWLHAETGQGGIDPTAWRGETVEVSFCARGGRVRLPGRGHSQRLKHFFQERGVPPWQRVRTPMIHIGGELAAVGDLCVCEPFAVAAHDQGLQISWHRPLPASGFVAVGKSAF